MTHQQSSVFGSWGYRNRDEQDIDTHHIANELGITEEVVEQHLDRLDEKLQDVRRRVQMIPELCES